MISEYVDLCKNMDVELTVTVSVEEEGTNEKIPFTYEEYDGDIRIFIEKQESNNESNEELMVLKEAITKIKVQWNKILALIGEK